MKAIVTVESLGLYNFVSFFYYQYGKTGKDRIPFLGYQTCLDPLNSNFSVPFYKVLPVNQCLLWSSTVCIVVFNIFLYKYLDKRTEENTGGTHQLFNHRVTERNSLIALSAVDEIKNRRRNLVSAKVGIMSLMINIFFLPVIAIAFSAPIELGKKGPGELAS